VGGLNDRLDFVLLHKLIKNNPRWCFVFWGPIQHTLIRNKPEVKEKLQYILSLPNVTHGRSANKREIANIISQFDICIIPYDSSLEFNKYSYPLKTFEYFYMGKPVISSPIKELGRFPNFVKIRKSAADWEKTIEKLLKKPWPETYKKKQQQIAKDNAWENKLENISLLIEKL